MGVPDLVAPLAEEYEPDAVLAAAADVRGFCGWHIAPELQETMTLDGSGTPSLLIPSLRVTAVATVVEDGLQLIAGTDYTWSESGILERAWGRWTTKRRGVVVTLTHGYQTCPLEVARVVARVAKGGLVPNRARSEIEGPYSVTWDPDSPAGAIDVHSERVLLRYQVPSIR